METKDILAVLRTQRGWTQEDLAQRCSVTRQAVSRWETGETLPNIETLKRLSDLFDVSLHALLGAPRQWICQCCGMPLEESILSQEPDGIPNVAYCQWCYTGGKFVYETQEALIDFLSHHLAHPQWPPEQVRAHLAQLLAQLDHWRDRGEE